jgi:hypothetical protein
MYPVRPAEDIAFGTWAAELISKILATGQFVPLPVKLIPKGLEGVKEGFQYMREGKASSHLSLCRWESGTSCTDIASR